LKKDNFNNREINNYLRGFNYNWKALFIPISEN
jgi:hypothetical protein